MPFYYGVAPATDFTTSATPGTEIDAMFIAPGSGRTSALSQLMVQGKGAQLTSLSGIVVRIKTYTSSASSGGTGVTPTPADQDAPAAKSTAGQATAGVTPGTGGPTVHHIVGVSGSGPNQWVAREPDDMVRLNSAAAKSVDFFNSSNTASLKLEQSARIYE